MLSATPIQVPVLGLSGARGGCIAPDVFRAAMPATLFSGRVTLEVWPDAGHFLHLEHPERTAYCIAAWMTRGS